MSSAWGDSWGAAWGDSWGAIAGFTPWGSPDWAHYGRKKPKEVTDEEIKAYVHQQRIALGIIPDDTPQVAVDIIESAVVESIKSEHVELLQEDFEAQSVRFKQEYAEYFKVFLQAMNDQIAIRNRRKRFMRFILMNE